MDFTSINGTTVVDLTVDQYKTAMDISMSLLGFSESDLVFEPRPFEVMAEDIEYYQCIDPDEFEIPF